MSFGVVAFATVCVAWMTATLFEQFGCRPRLVRRLSSVAVIPRWLFFAPEPERFDYFLVYRDHAQQQVYSPFKVALAPSARRPWAVLWNPRKHELKLAGDIVRRLVQLARDMPERDLAATLPYLMLLEFVTTLPHEATARAVQFAILRRRGVDADDDFSVVMTSAMHRLADQ